MAVTLATVALPLVGAALAALTPVRFRPIVALASLSATLLAAVLLVTGLRDGAPREVFLGGAQGSFGVLVGDGLAAALILLCTSIVLLTALFAVLDRVPDAVRPAHWPLSLALLAGMHGVFLAGDLLTAYLMLELVAVTGASMVAWGGSRAQLAAGTRYFYAELVASVTFLVGAALLWSASGTVVIAELADGMGDGVVGVLGLALTTVGLLLKVPVVPLHFWLPAAHALAPSAVSPVLSALVVKTSFVLLLRILVAGLPGFTTTAFAQLLGVLGAVAVIWGGVTALRADGVKRVIAYSTVAQLGMLLIALPMALTGSSEAWFGAVLHAIAHALPKAAVLMAVGLLARTLGGDTVDELRGAATRRPLATFVVGLAGLSLIGLPPTGGFIAKWYLVVGSIRTGQWWWAVIIVVGSLLTAAYLARLLQRCFTEPDAPDTRVAPEYRATDVVALTLAGAGLVLGLYPTPLIDLLGVDAPLGVIADD